MSTSQRLWELGFHSLFLEWVLGRTGRRLVLCYMAPALCLAAGFWRTKFDPSLTQKDSFHLDEQFTVPVDMMHAQSYPLRWFLLEQPEIQVTLGLALTSKLGLVLGGKVWSVG